MPTNTTVRPFTFFVATFLFSWVFWLTGILWNIEHPISVVFLAIGSFGPSLMGILLCFRNSGRNGVRDLWRRFAEIRRIPMSWMAFVLLFSPVVAVLSCLFDRLLGGDPPSFHAQVLSSPYLVLQFILMMIVGGPLAEEFGWRGVALDGLQERLRALPASVVLGIVWGAWHIPLFFMAGTSQAAMEVGSVLFWLWFADVVSGSVVYSWVYNNTSRSVFSAFLLHFMCNSTYVLLAGLGGSLTIQYEVISICLRVAVALTATWFLYRQDRNRSLSRSASE